MSNVFKGEVKVGTQSLMGKADIKRLRSQLMDEFPTLTKRMLDKVLRSKEDVDINVLKCTNGTQLYVPGDGPPAFFDDGFGAVFPTLFTLWKLPAIMPELVTHGPVSKFLLPKERSAGADMMLPGVIVPDDGLGSFAAGQKRCMRVEGNDAPFAVGKMLVSDADIKKTGMKGKGMAVLHVYRDSLWTYGGRKVPNDGFLADEITASTGSAGAEEAEEEEEEEEEEEKGGVRPSGERSSGARAERASNASESVEQMEPDALMEYCFWAAFKLTCTDAELPITADKFYTQHMQPARPAGQPVLDAKKTSYKQVGKFIKHMYKHKYCNVRDVKGTITLLAVDRSSPVYHGFELAGSSHKEAAKAEEASEGGAKAKDEEVVALRTKPPVVTDMWQPNSYTKPIFEAVGLRDKHATYTLAESHRVLDKYIRTRLVPPPPPTAAGAEDALPTAPPPPPAAPDDEVIGTLRHAGLPAAAATAAAGALAADGFDSLAALKAGRLEAWELANYGVDEAHSEAVLKVLAGEAPDTVRAWLQGTAGVGGAVAAATAAAMAADGFESVTALCAGALSTSDLQAYGAGADGAAAIAKALAALKVTETGSGGGGGSGERVSSGGDDAGGESRGLPDYDTASVPLDETLLNGLVKLAGGAKKGATFASHLPLADLQAAMQERMTAFHRVEVEGEAPSIRKGALKPIMIEMKRAAGHNKTHVSGLESFCITPQAVADALKVKLGCTTAVLKLPGNTVKDMEVLLQGHCVNEVVDYLRDVYCVGKEWIELKLKESKRSNT